MIKVAILGSTGSIGTQALDVIRKHKTLFSVKALVCHSNVKLLMEQKKEFYPSFVGIINQNILDQDIQDVHFGEECLEEAVKCGVDKVIVATSGITALKAVVTALENNIDVLIANKESLVCGGELIKKAQAKSKAKLIPVDSEHSAIFQCLQGENEKEIEKLILTASGGAFLGFTRSQLENVTAENALKHPKWTMGNKITIDSATLMNKGLEIIEAQLLFDMQLEKIQVVVHPQSIVHSAVEFVDGSILAQLSQPDMRLPIQYALGYPNRLPSDIKKLDFVSFSKLEFFEPDEKTFSCLTIAKHAAKKGGLYPAALCAANDVCVDAFLQGKLRFLDIANIVEDTIANFPLPAQEITLENIANVQFHAKSIAQKAIDKNKEI